MEEFKTRKEVINYYFEGIKNRLGNPPVKLVSRKEFENTAIRVRKGTDGMCNTKYNTIWINSNQTATDLIDTIHHEILHCLFPEAEEWWIVLSSLRLSESEWCYNMKILEKELGHKRKEIPSYKELLKMSFIQSARMRELPH